MRRFTMSAAAAAVIVVLFAATSANAGLFAVTRVGEAYFTKMIGGGASTGHFIQHVTDNFKEPSNPTTGDPMTSPMCLMFHDADFRFDSSSAFTFAPSDLTVSPLTTGPDQFFLRVKIASATMVVSLASFRASCEFQQPFHGSVAVRVDAKGVANFTFTGPMEWHLPVKVASPSTVAVLGATLMSTIPFTPSYAYTSTSQYLFDPYAKLWFAQRAKTLQTQMEKFVTDHMATRYFVPLAQMPLDVLTSYTYNNTCGLSVDNDRQQLNITSGQGGCSGPVPQFPYLPGADIQVITNPETLDASAPSDLRKRLLGAAIGAPSSPVWHECQSHPRDFGFPTNFYHISYTERYCFSNETAARANLADISKVDVVFNS